MPVKRNFNTYFQDVKNVNINREQKSNSSNFEIEGLLKPLMKNGKFTIVLRFLPSKPVDGEDVPFIENRNHMMQLPNGQWFGCDCAKKWKDSSCPICDYNSKIYTKYGRTDEARSKALPKWKPEFYANVYVVKNPNQPDTEGKVYRLKFGRAIMKFITDAMEDKNDAEAGKIPGINPFSWYGPNDKEVLSGENKAGANFVWEGVQGSNGPNYNDSHFGKPSRIAKLDSVTNTLVEMNDAEIDAVESQLWTLKDIERKKEQIKTYNEILELYKKKAGEDLMKEFSAGDDYVATTTPKATSYMENTVAVNDDDIFGSRFTETTSNSSMPFDDDSSDDGVTKTESDFEFFQRISGKNND